MKIGLIQTRGIGDIIIALPIAKFLVDRGHTVLWPIHGASIEGFRAAAPYVEFLPLDSEHGQFMYPIPHAMLKSAGCDPIIPLYAHLEGRPDLVNQGLAKFLKFDQYKYAVIGVPFAEKWNLKIERNREREEALFRRVVRQADYVVFHLQTATGTAQVDMSAIAQGRQCIEITPLTDNIFDWLTVIERASLRVMVDCCFSNLVDQLQIPGEKIFLVKSPIELTPVLLGDWSYVTS